MGRKTPSILRFVLALFIVAASAEATPHYKTLTFLHTNDIHGRLFDFSRDGSRIGGYARHATILKGYHPELPRVILVSAGDTWNRGPIGFMKGRPDVEAMKQIGYELWTLGNGEFYDGLDNIEERARQAQIPVLSANVLRNGRHLVQPWIIQNLDGLRIGFFGLTAPRIANYGIPEMEVLDPIETSREVVAQLEGKVDALIAVTHIGYDLDMELARQVPEIDLIIGGDSHTEIPVPELVKHQGPRQPLALHATPVVQAGDLGRFVGYTVLYLRSDESTPWTPVSVEGRMIPVDADIPEDSDMCRLLAHYAGDGHKSAGTLPAALPPYAENQPSVAQMAADAVRQAAGADIAMYNYYLAQEGLPEGQVTSMDIWTALPFNEGSTVALLTREQILQIAQIQNSCISGGTFVRDSDGRVVDVLVNGAPLGPAGKARVAARSSEFRGVTGDMMEREDMMSVSEAVEQWLNLNNPPED